MKTISLLGSTGLVGSHLLKLLEQESCITQIRTFTRRPYETPVTKHINWHDPNLDYKNCHPDFFISEIFISCLGTTIQQAKTTKNFRRIDYGFNLEAAKLYQQYQGKHFILLSSINTNPKSLILYNRIKGEIERDIKKLEFPLTTIVKPSLFLGHRPQQKRPLEAMAQIVYRSINPLLRGNLKPYRAVDFREVAQVILNEVMKRKNHSFIRLERQDLRK